MNTLDITLICISITLVLDSIAFWNRVAVNYRKNVLEFYSIWIRIFLVISLIIHWFFRSS